MDDSSSGETSERSPLLKAKGDKQKYLEKKKAEIPFPACRHVLTLMGFFCFASAYSMRVNLSVAIVAMVNSTAQGADVSASEVETDCLSVQQQSNDSSSAPTKEGEFEWTATQTGLVLSAHFYGYLTSQVVAGQLAERYGGKHVVGCGILGAAFASLLSPVTARTSFALFVAVRILEGVAGGLLYPGFHALISQWVPSWERSKLSAFTYTGTTIGTVVTMSLSGVMSDVLGWPSVFYTFGSLACVWWIFWILLVHSTPSQHPRVSAAERDYIETAIGLETRHIKMATPWLSILTSLPFWAILVAHVTHNWGKYLLQTSLPQFLSDILLFDIASSGILSGLPYLAAWMVGNLSGQLADFLIYRGLASVAVVRKLMNIGGQLGPGLFLILAGYVGCSRVPAMIMITLGVACVEFHNAGGNVNHLDIAPRFAGTLMGATNTAASLSGVFAPMAAAAMTDHHNTREQWLKLFYITGAIALVGSTFFSIFASGVEQTWARPPRETSDNGGGIKRISEESEPVTFVSDEAVKSSPP